MNPAIATAPVPRSAHLLTISAATTAELDRRTARLVDYLRQHPQHALADVARALATDRPASGVGRTLVATDAADAIAAFASPDRVRTAPLGAPREVVFLFPGLGEQYVHMGAGLYQREPVFRAAVDACAELARPLLELDLRDVLGVSGGAVAPAPQLDLRRMLGRGEPTRDDGLLQTYLAQPAIFVIEYAMAQLWLSWGLVPAAMMGYSIGEYVAACLADVVSLADALRLVILRARLIQHSVAPGAMLAVPLPVHEVEPLLGPEVSLAAINGDALCVVAGSPAAIDQVQARLADQGQPAIRVHTSHAFHSRMMEPVARDFEAIAKTCAVHPPRIPYISNVTGTWIGDAAPDPTYWVAHLCKPVRCADGLRALWREPTRVFLEVGPGRALTTLALHNAPETTHDAAALSSLRTAYESASDAQVALDTLGRLWLLGVPIAWDRVLGPAVDDTASRALHAALDADTAMISPTVATAPRATGTLRPRPGLFTAYTAPRTELERTLVELWQRTLKLAPVGVDDSFFELGGHSLLAISIANQLEREAKIQIAFAAIFEHATIAQLARWITQGSTTSAIPAPQAHHASYVLPNGLAIWHQNKAETDHFYEDIFTHRTYVRHLADWPRGACVFDVGSNIGLFSLFVHTLDPSAKIYAFEPSAPTFEVLRHNLTQHGVNATLFEAGLSDADKTVELTFYPYSSGMTSVYGDYDEELAVLRGIIENQAQGDPAAMGQVIDNADALYRQRLVSQTLPCRLRTLSSVIREHAIERIDLLKIDVQKSELDVLRGIAPEDWGKIAAIAIEVHDLAGRLAEIAQLLAEHGYRVETVQDELYRGTGIYLLYATR